MYNYYLNEIRDFFYTKLSETDKNKFQAIKADIYAGKKKWNYVVIAVIFALILVFTILQGGINFDSLDQWGSFVFIAIMLFVINNFESQNTSPVWKKFLDILIASTDNWSKYEDLDDLHKEYFEIRDYVLQKTDFSLLDIEEMINQLIIFKVEKEELPSEKNKRHRYHEYHYFSILEELKLRGIDTNSEIAYRKFSLKLLIIWTVVIMPVAIILLYFSIESTWFIFTLAMGLMVIWFIIFLVLFMYSIAYIGSKHETITKWEKLIVKQGWDIFERPGILFSDFATLDNYATFYYQQTIADN